jgi:hypothetical protein
MKAYNEYKSERELVEDINACIDIETSLILIDYYINLIDWYWQTFFMKGDGFEDMDKHYYDKSDRLGVLKEQLNTENELIIINQIKEIINEKSE